MIIEKIPSSAGSYGQIGNVDLVFERKIEEGKTENIL